MTRPISVAEPDKLRTYTFTASPKAMADIAARAAREGISISKWIRRALDAARKGRRA